MKKIIGLILAILVAAAALYIYFNDQPQRIIFEGKEYQYRVYDCSKQNLTFSRVDKNPALLHEYEWIVPAALTLGFAYMETMSETQLQSYFEKPPANAKDGASKILAASKLDGEITVVSAVEYKIGKESYLFVGLKRSDLPNGVMYAHLLKVKGKWIMPSRSRDPDGNILGLMSKLSKEIDKHPKKLKDLRSL